jgi:hypothetical protein
MRQILIIIFILFSTTTFARKAKVKYEYKKFERFDFDALDVQGTKGAPGELSIPTRLKSKYKNKLPERRHFNREMKRAIDTVI